MSGVGIGRRDTIDLGGEQCQVMVGMGGERGDFEEKGRRMGSTFPYLQGCAHVHTLAHTGQIILRRCSC